MNETPPRTGGFIASADGEHWQFAGALTFKNAEGVLEAANALPLPSRDAVDLGGLETADSAALAVLLALRRRAAAEGRQLAFTSVPASIVSLARVYGIDTLVGV